MFRHETFFGSNDKATQGAMAHAEELKTWMTANPGEPVYRASIRHGPSGFIEVLCVR